MYENLKKVCPYIHNPEKILTHRNLIPDHRMLHRNFPGKG